MVLPSLILRLAHLEQPAAPAQGADVLRRPETGQPLLPAQPGGSSAEPAEPGESSEATVDIAAAERIASSSSLNRWSAAVAAAHDGCFVLDVTGAVISVSVAGVELLGSGDGTVIGQHLLDVINLVDLESGAVNPEYAPRITPLVALENPGLARSLMRVRHPDGTVVTLDSSSAPIHDASGQLLGSMTFISPIPTR